MPLLPCPICNHVALERIENDLGRNVPHEVIVGRYGLSQDLLNEHLDKCLAPPTPQSILETAVAMNRAALRMLRKALDDGDTKTALSAFDRADRSLTTIARLTGALSPDAPAVDLRSQTINIALDRLSVEELRALASLDDAS